MPTCFVCGKKFEKLTPSGMCENCSGTSSRPAPSKDPTLIGLSSRERSIVMEQRAEIKAQERAHADRVKSLLDRGCDGYYEYKVVDLRDIFTGSVDIKRMSSLLNDLGLDGWRLRTAYSNDLGVNAVKVGGVGLNSSVSQNILIFERYVRVKL